MTIERRGFLVGAAAAIGGVVYSKGLAAMLADAMGADNAVPMMQRDAYIDQDIDAFTTEKRALVSAMSETLLPRSDTAGAIDAGVPKFLELLYAQWMGPDEKALFDSGLGDADKQAQAAHGKSFANADAGAQKSVMEAMEEAQGDHPWFELGGQSVGKVRKDITFMALFKEITVTGFFMSEVGAKDVMRYNPMPGKFDGDIGLTSDESSWAATPLM